MIQAAQAGGSRSVADRLRLVRQRSRTSDRSHDTSGEHADPHHGSPPAHRDDSVGEDDAEHGSPVAPLWENPADDRPIRPAAGGAYMAELGDMPPPAPAGPPRVRKPVRVRRVLADEGESGGDAPAPAAPPARGQGRGYAAAMRAGRGRGAAPAQRTPPARSVSPPVEEEPADGVPAALSDIPAGR
jgi:hypothetical protein